MSSTEIREEQGTGDRSASGRSEVVESTMT